MSHLLRCLARAAWACALIAAISGAAWAEGADYIVRPGDTIEVSVAGIPDLRREATVDLDGFVDVPLLGRIVMSGRSINEIEAELKRELPKLAFTQTSYDGGAFQSPIFPNAVGVRVSEYRPIFVGGHVKIAGEQPFRPGLTARQALARAGGASLLTDQSINPALLAADLRTELEELRLEATHLDFARMRVDAELGGKKDIEFGTGLVGDEYAKRTASREKAEFIARIGRMDEDRSSLLREQGQLEKRLAFLEDQLDKELGAADADAENEARVRDSYERRLTPFKELAAAQRFALTSAARARSVSADMAEVSRQLEELRREEGRLADNRRVELLEEAQGIDARIAAIGHRMASARSKLVHAAGINVGVFGLEMDAMSVVIHRIGEVDNGAIDAGLDALLKPGDVVTFTLPEETLRRIYGVAMPGPVRESGRDGGASGQLNESPSGGNREAETDDIERTATRQ